MLKLRPFEVADSAAMIDLFYRSVHEAACEYYDADQLDAWAPKGMDACAWTKRCLSRATWLAFKGDQLAGFIEWEADGHIDLLYVHPDFQRCGIAHALYHRVLDEKMPRLYVEASHAARGFFERFGFSVDEEQSVHRNGQVLTNFKMSKTF